MMWFRASQAAVRVLEKAGLPAIALVVAALSIEVASADEPNRPINGAGPRRPSRGQDIQAMPPGSAGSVKSASDSSAGSGRARARSGGGRARGIAAWVAMPPWRSRGASSPVV